MKNVIYDTKEIQSQDTSLKISVFMSGTIVAIEYGMKTRMEPDEASLYD
jgi:hypothetical protein